MKKGFLALLISLCILGMVYAEDSPTITSVEPFNSAPTVIKLPTQPLDPAIIEVKQARIKELKEELSAISKKYNSIQKLMSQLERKAIEIAAVIRELER